MKRKKAISLALVFALLLGVSAAYAAGAGSAEDPLISLSYASGEYTQSVRSEADALFEGTLAGAAGGTTGSFETVSLAAGGRVELETGGSIILLSGSATITISSGAVVNVTVGYPAQTGRVVPGHRYLAAENADAVVTVSEASLLALDGGARVGSGQETPYFTDVPASHWGYTYIMAMAQQGYISGRGDGTFDPDANMTRADFVTVLGRMAGISTGSYTGSAFSDVAVSEYYAPYVQWAAQNGIVSGYDDGLFYPNAEISREEMAVVIVRYAAYAGLTLASADAREPFSDHDSIQGWAIDAVYTAKNSGLLAGRGNNEFAPGGNATRAEVCTVLTRLLDLR